MSQHFKLSIKDKSKITVCQSLLILAYYTHRCYSTFGHRDEWRRDECRLVTSDTRDKCLRDERPLDEHRRGESKTMYSMSRIWTSPVFKHVSVIRALSYASYLDTFYTSLDHF